MKIKDNIISFDAQGTNFTQALPLGNGRIGAMIYGGVLSDTVMLSESTVWSGKLNESNDNPEGPVYIKKIQDALLANQSEEVINPLLGKAYGKMDDFGTSRPLGNLILQFRSQGNITDYSRSLDIENGICTIEYKDNGVSFKREAFISNPDQVFAMRFSCRQSGSISMVLKAEQHSLNPNKCETRSEGNCITHKGTVYDGGMSICAKAKVINKNGKVTAGNGMLKVDNADEIIIFVAVETDYLKSNPEAECDKKLSDAVKKGYDNIINDHKADFSPLFNSMAINIGEENDFYRFWFSYARYLNLSASRKNSPLPMHLQGIWNDNLCANMNWNCDFHIDINSQMNQWFSTSGNLPEGNIALGSFLRNIVMPSGTKTAKVQYGKKGWVVHTVTNAWGYTSSTNALWSIFPAAGAWIAQSLWDQYDYFRDLKFLEETAYPVLKGSAEFFLDFLIENGQGYLVTAPSTSPENGKLTIMPACDRVILYGLFESVIEASMILNKDEQFRKAVTEAKNKLPPIRISRHGQIMEWYDDITDGNTNHRHLSHLLALYPYSQITVQETPQLAKAAEISMERRYNAKGWEATEFTGANLAGFYARLGKGDKALEMINSIKDSFTFENLLTFSPAGIAGAEEEIFIIDGNMGMAAAMAEMFLQSYNGTIYLLPALPSKFKEGCIRGLKARGGYEIDLKWECGKLLYADIKQTGGKVRCKVSYNNKITEINLKTQQAFRLTNENFQ